MAAAASPPYGKRSVREERRLWRRRGGASRAGRAFSARRAGGDEPVEPPQLGAEGSGCFTGSQRMAKNDSLKGNR